MRRIIVLVSLAVLTSLVSIPARADLIYSFASTTDATGFGAMSGSFTVANSAILDGVIDAAEITSYSFADSVFTFAPPPGVLAANVSVDSTTGALLNFGALTLFEDDADAPFPSEISTFITGTGSVSYVRVGDAPNLTGVGFGEWSVAVPEPGSLGLCAAIGLGLVLFRRQKKSPA